MRLLGIEIPPQVQIGKNFKLLHSGFGVVLHPTTSIGDNVTMFHAVTVGRANVYEPAVDGFMGVRIEDGAFIGAGAVILCKSGRVVVARDSVVGANCVLLQSTGPGEIWAGNPGKMVGVRKI